MTNSETVTMLVELGVIAFSSLVVMMRMTMK